VQKEMLLNSGCIAQWVQRWTGIMLGLEVLGSIPRVHIFFGIGNQKF
jgi:hypothetical protein